MLSPEGKIQDPSILITIQFFKEKLLPIIRREPWHRAHKITALFHFSSKVYYAWHKKTPNKRQLHFAAHLKHSPEQSGHDLTEGRDGKGENSYACN